MSTRHLWTLGAFGLALVGAACADEEASKTKPSASKTKQEASPDGPEADAPVELVLADDPGDQSSYTLRPKMNVSSIVLERYGSRHYSRMILLHNDIDDPSRLPVGTVIETPSLALVLEQEAGLFDRARAELEALLEVRRAYLAIEPELAAIVEAAPDRRHLTVPPTLGAQLAELAKRLDVVGEQLAKDRPDTNKPPTKMIASVLGAAVILEQLAAGQEMDEAFDTEEIHKRLGNAFADAMIWARVERR
jgi:hypothetical protein